MKRTRLTSLFAVLGLGLGACEREGGQLVEPQVDPDLDPLGPRDDLDGVEPSGLGRAPKPTTMADSGGSESDFEGIPTHFCHTRLVTLDQPLLRTESFLHAWNELSTAADGQVVPNIPTTEFDARFALCGAQQRCSSDAPMVVETTAAYRVEAGVLLPGEAGMLVIPGIGEPHAAGVCAGDTVAIVEQQGSLAHVRATNHTRRYDYVNFHGYDYGGYGRAAGECITEVTHRRDLVVDARSGRLVLRLDQFQPGEGGEPWIEVTLAAQTVTLSGCDDVLELQWTGR